jgi:hypothetical protein
VSSNRPVVLCAGFVLLWSVVVIGCEDSSTRAARDAGRMDAFTMDFQVALPDVGPPPPDGPIRDAWRPDASGDAGMSEQPKYVIGRETALKLLRARNRTIACVYKVHGERVLDSLGNAHAILYQLNEAPAPGIYDHQRRQLECDNDPSVDTCEKYLECIRLQRIDACKQVSFNGIAFCGTDDQYVICLPATSWGMPTDCRASGGTCPEGSGADYGCFYGPCDPDVYGACADGLRFMCDGFNLRPMDCARETICTQRVGFSFDDFDCARYANPTCEVVEYGARQPAATCTGTGPPCELSEVPRCVDDRTVEACAWPGRLTHLDCDTYWAGSRCVPDWGDGGGAACDFGHDCTRHPATCVEGRLRVCVAGRWEYLDCPAMGMRCEESIQGRETYACFYPD